MSLVAAAAQAGPAPVGHWTLDETGTPATVADSSGNNLTGNVVGTTAATGQVDGARHFAGGEYDEVGDTYAVDHVSIPHDDLLNITGALSIAFWIKPNPMPEWPEDQFVIAKRRDGAASPYTVGLNNFGDVLFGYGPVDGASPWPGLNMDHNTGPALAVNTWAHIVCTRNADCTRLRIWLNGVMVVEGVGASRPAVANDHNLFFARSNQKEFDSFSGDLDDIQIFNVELTEQEINDVMAGSSTPTASVLASDDQAAEDGDSGSSAATAAFALSLSAAPSENITVNLTIADSDPTSGGDYTVQGATSAGGDNYTVAFDTVTTSATVTIVPANDTAEEFLQTVTVTVVSGTGYSVAAAPGNTAQCTITDDDINAPGTFSLVEPISDVELPYDQDVVLKWGEPTHSTSSPTVYDVELADNASFTSPIVDESGLTIVASGGECTYTVAASLIEESQSYWWRVTASNDGGPTQASNNPGTFHTATDTTEPTVLSTSPAADATDADPGADIRITFSEVVAFDGDLNTAVTVAGVTGTVTQPAQNTLVFSPSTDLEEETTYTVTLSPNIHDMAKSPNDLDGDAGVLTGYSFSFETWQALAGLATGEGCVPGGESPLAEALFALAAVWVVVARRGVRAAAG
jgi:hypothetical protein